MVLARFVRVACTFLLLGCGSRHAEQKEPATVVHVEPPSTQRAVSPREAAVQDAPPPKSSAGDDDCKDLDAAIPSRNDQTIWVFIRSGAPTCVGPIAVTPGNVERAASAAVDRGVEAAVIHADESVQYKRVVEVMDGLRRGGIRRMMMAVHDTP